MIKLLLGNTSSMKNINIKIVQNHHKKQETQLIYSYNYVK